MSFVHGYFAVCECKFVWQTASPMLDRRQNPSSPFKTVALRVLLSNTEQNPHRRTQKHTQKEKTKSLKMKRNPYNPSLSLRLPPLTLSFLSVISHPLKQHLLQTRSLEAPSWCSVPSCIIQCLHPASHSAHVEVQGGMSSSSKSLMLFGSFVHRTGVHGAASCSERLFVFLFDSSHTTW